MRKILALALTTVLSVAVVAQNQISGIVKSKSGDPLPFAVLKIEDSFVRGLSQGDGSFNIETDKTEVQLEVSFIGFQTKILTTKAPAEKLEVVLDPGTVNIGSAIVEATRVGQNTPMTATDVSSEQLEKINLGQDLPILLGNTPSVVTTSDAGAGVGYTGIRMRGVDASQINVTINGIVLNDSEEQGVFWVNIPNIAGSTDNVQIQRGVGTSTNGSGAFGGTINLQTAQASQKAFGEISGSIGSFNTAKTSVSFGSGLLNDKFYINGNLSQINSDGYVDRATSDLNSFYLSAGYIGTKTSLNLLAFGGHEVTYQSWYGTPEAWAKNDEGAKEAALERNGWGFSDLELENLRNSGRTFNFYDYQNQVDDYRQNHYQLHLNHHFNANWSASLSGHYTYGRGFFEEFKKDEDVSDYGISPFQLASDLTFADVDNGDGTFSNSTFENFLDYDGAIISQTLALDSDGNQILNADGFPLLNLNAQIEQSDFVRRRWLQNDFYGATWNFNYKKGKINALLGGATNYYDGDHFGEIIYATTLPDNFINDVYYTSYGRKLDNSVYGKVYFEATSDLTVFADVQARVINYQAKGTDSDLAPIDFSRDFNFINPKGGISYKVSSKDNLYGSVAVANREPRRSDILDAPEGVEVEPENLTDFELGYKRNSDSYFVNANLYLMQYKNQLIPTGELNDVGAPVRTNAGTSFRRGLELELGYRINKKFELYGNATFSENKIESFTEIVEDYTNGFEYEINKFDNVDIALSPAMIASGTLSFFPIRNEKNILELAWTTKHVGDQFLDNTASQTRKIDAYTVSDFRLSYSLKPSWIGELQINAMMYNALDAVYSANGYTYNYIVGEKIVENLLYPQAGRNFMIGITLKM